MASRPRAARTHRPGTGSSPGRRSISTGAISRETIPAFPEALSGALIAEGKLPGILGDRHASGTAVIEDFGEEHVRTGKPICYTSADSVLQIAAHEETFGRERLYELCRIARRLCDPLNIGRVIARPFVGRTKGDFARTPYRKDFAMPPPDGNLLQRAAHAGRAVVSIGKIGDIFAHRDTGHERKGKSNDGNVDLLIDALATTEDGGFIFVNLVDFDTDWGHRRDVAGYAACLEAFDERLAAIEAALKPSDFCIITADHGNDPTFRGFDHTREHVPILSLGAGAAAGPIGRRATLRRRRGDDRREARPAARAAWDGVANVSFSLDERLARDTSVIGDLALSRVLLMNDTRWAWLILVPRRPGLIELADLAAGERRRLLEEATRAAAFLKAYAEADKINIGALGNVVRQLHLHVVARTIGDAGWPGPVWGLKGARPYDDASAHALMAAAHKALRLTNASSDAARQ